MGTEPQIRDFTASRTPKPHVSVTMHSAVDLLATLWILDGCDELEFDSYALGSDWFETLRDRLSAETRHNLERIGAGEVWISVMSFVTDLEYGSTIADFLELLEGYDPVELRSRLISMKEVIPDESRETARAAAEGDLEAVAEILALPVFADHKRWQDSVRLILELPPEASRDLLAATMKGFYEEAFVDLESEFRPILERDGAAKQAMAQELSPERLVELATNGISIEGSRYRRPVLLMPVIVSRPWVVFTPSPEDVVICYPVADEYMQADPDAPPEWLIKTYKALGDERRLRMLRILSRGPASLHELTKEIGASKSTVHHHLMLLRAAGLVKVTIGTEKEYSLRKDVVPETAAVLQAYIDTEKRES